MFVLKCKNGVFAVQNPHNIRQAKMHIFNIRENLVFILVSLNIFYLITYKNLNSVLNTTGKMFVSLVFKSTCDFCVPTIHCTLSAR